MENLEGIINEISGGKILDIATGGGDFLKIIANFKNIKEIIAIDKMERMKDVIEKNKGDLPVSFITMDAINLQFEPKSFNTVCLSNSLHHLEQIKKVFTEISRVLCDDGLFIINEMVSDELSPAQISHKLIHHFAAKLDRINNVFHNDTYTKEEISRLIEDSSFEIVKYTDYSFNQEDPKNPELIQYFVDYIERLHNMVREKEYNKNTEYFDELENIKKYIEINGYASATSVFYVLKKS